MNFGPAVNTFVLLWIFVPLLLVGVVELLRTPKPTHISRETMRRTAGYAPGASIDPRTSARP